MLVAVGAGCVDAGGDARKEFRVLRLRSASGVGGGGGEEGSGLIPLAGGGVALFGEFGGGVGEGEGAVLDVVPVGIGDRGTAEGGEQDDVGGGVDAVEHEALERGGCLGPEGETGDQGQQGEAAHVAIICLLAQEGQRGDGANWVCFVICIFRVSQVRLAVFTKGPTQSRHSRVRSAKEEFPALTLGVMSAEDRGQSSAADWVCSCFKGLLGSFGRKAFARGLGRGDAAAGARRKRREIWQKRTQTKPIL